MSLLFDGFLLTLLRVFLLEAIIKPDIHLM